MRSAKCVMMEGAHNSYSVPIFYIGYDSTAFYTKHNNLNRNGQGYKGYKGYKGLYDDLNRITLYNPLPYGLIALLKRSISSSNNLL